MLQKNYEVQLKKNQQQDGLEQPTRNKTGSQKPIKYKTEPKQPIKDKNSMVIKGVTFYKAEEANYNEEEDEEEVEEEEKGKSSKSDVPLWLIVLLLCHIMYILSGLDATGSTTFFLAVETCGEHRVNISSSS